MSPLVSVIIPVYNDEEGLEITLQSLQNQSLSPNDYEIVVSNDGGQPSIEELCQSYHVSCINITPNQGSYNARNQAIKNSKGSILAFVDADIILPSNWLERGVSAINNADYVAGPVQIIKNDSMTVPELYEYYTAFSSERYIREFKFGVTGNLFVKREVFDKIGLFNNQLRSGGDFEFGNRVHMQGELTQTFDEDLAVYHPPRGHNKYIKKVRRVSEGVVTLTTLNTVDHSRIEPSILKSIAKIVLPPHPLKTKLYQKKANPFIPLYIYHWYMNMHRGYYTIRAMLKKGRFKFL